MLILDTTTRSLEIVLAGAITTSQLPVVANFVDITTTTFAPTASNTASNSMTAVTIVSAPAASTQRQVKFLSVFNADTAAATVTIRLNDNATTRILCKIVLQVGDQLFYTDGEGWRLLDSTGSSRIASGTVNVVDAASDTTTWVMLAGSQTGSQAPLSDSGLTYNATTDALTATTFVGALSGNATTATTLATARAIYGNNFDGSAALSQIIASTFGGTGNGFTKFSGPTTSEKTKTLRDATDTVLELGGSYTPTGTWTSLVMVTPTLGTPASGTLTNCTGLPISTGVSGLGTGVATFLATPSSANLIAAVTDETGSGALVFGTSPTITTPVLTGLPTGSGVASAATASTLASRDANANLSADVFIAGYTTTATMLTTTTLTVNSTYAQFFTGITTQNCDLPVTSTLVLGQTFRITNNSTGVVTVRSSGANTVIAMAASTEVEVTCILITGTTAASWDFKYRGSATTGGGGLTNFVESANTSSPNNTVNASRLLVVATSTNADFVLQPKGTGAILGQLPDSSAAGGNKRGTNAVDLQTKRSAATQVSSGAGAGIGGGQYNTNSATNGVLGGGSGGSVSGTHGVIGGGYNNDASGAYSSVAGGSLATTRSLIGMAAIASGMFVTRGDAQRGQYILRAVTTDATQTTLSADQNAASLTNQCVLANNSNYAIWGLISAHRTDVIGTGAGWYFYGTVRRGANAAAIVVPTAITNVSTGNDPAATTWAVSIGVNTTIGSIAVKFTGEAAKTIRVVCVMQTTEVTS